MSVHSFSSCWLHIVFSTLNREKNLNPDVRPELSEYFKKYSEEKGIYHRINFVNADHVHLLIDLPTNLTVEQVLHLYKGSSSYWINKSGLIKYKFAWERGYGVFSVSQSNISIVSNYILNQAEHHRVKTFKEEFDKMMKIYNMKYVFTG